MSAFAKHQVGGGSKSTSWRTSLGPARLSLFAVLVSISALFPPSFSATIASAQGLRPHTTTIFNGANGFTYVTNQGQGFTANAIYRSNFDGSNNQFFLNGSAFHAWSPDGTLVAYYSGGWLTVADSSGNNAHHIAGMDSSSPIAWSPSGGSDSHGNRIGRLAFYSFDELYIINADGTGEKSLWGRNEDPCMYFPVGETFLDESTIAFTNAVNQETCDTLGATRNVLYPRPNGLFKISVSGGSPSLIDTSTRNSCPFYPVASPDGSQIAYDDQDQSGNTHVYLMPSSGTGGISAANAQRLTPAGDRNDQTGGWSPGGSYFIFSSEAADGSSYSIEDIDVGTFLGQHLNPTVLTPVQSGWYNQLPEFQPITTPVVSVHDQSYDRPSTGTTVVQVPVSLSFPPKITGTVSYSAQDGSGDSGAIAGTDYDVTPGTLTFDPSVRTQHIPVTIHAGSASTSKSFTITLSSASHLVLGQATATITIRPTPAVSIQDQTFFYPASGSKVVDVPVQLNVTQSNDVSVDYAATNGDATNGVDYSLTAGTLTIPAGQLSANIAVTINAPAPFNTAGASRNFSIALSNPSAAIQLGHTPAEITLTLPSVRIADQTFNRPLSDNQTVDVPVVLSAPPQDTVTVDFAAVDGTATAGTDYQLSPATLTWSPGDATTKNIRLTLLPHVVHDLESFTIKLSNPSDNLLISRSIATITLNPTALIVNDPGDETAIQPDKGVCDTGLPLVGGQSDCTLRAAIQVLNSNPGTFSQIIFNIPAAGATTIHLGSALPTINQTVTIDGTSQRGGVVTIDASGIPRLLFNEMTPIMAAAPVTLKGLAIYGAVHSQPLIWLGSSASGSKVLEDLIGTDRANDVKTNGLGIFVNGAQNVTIQGNTIGNFQGLGQNQGGVRIDDGLGVELVGANGVQILGNNFGGSSGSQALINARAAILVQDSHGVTVGGPDPSDKNVIVSSGDGIQIEGDSPDTEIVGNQIGSVGVSPPLKLRNTGNGITDSALGTVIKDNIITTNDGNGILVDIHGSLAIIAGNVIGNDGANALANNGDGILIKEASSVTIGGPNSPQSCSDPCNLIGGNQGAGIHLEGADSTDIFGNFIGYHLSDSQGLPNATGVLIEYKVKDAHDNHVGDLDAGDGNMIAFNSGPGIQVDLPAPLTVNNSFLSNAIFSNQTKSNGGEQIYLLAAANGNVMPATLQAASQSIGSNKLTVSGKLPGKSSYLVQFFWTAICPGAQPTNGSKVMLSSQVRPAASSTSFSLQMQPPQAGNGFVTTTVTTLDSKNSPLSTSEFSMCSQIKTAP